MAQLITAVLLMFQAGFMVAEEAVRQHTPKPKVLSTIKEATCENGQSPECQAESDYDGKPVSLFDQPRWAEFDRDWLRPAEWHEP